ncbi:MAG: FxsA family protein [Marmoricola sp.]
MKRRRFPWGLLVLAFIGVPILEIYVIIQVGHVIGAGWTILLLIADSLFGSWLLRREGGRAWRALQTALSQGKMPARELADGILILVGGALMLSPGFVLDVVGLVAILPFTRPLGRKVLAGFISRRLVVQMPGAAGRPGTWPGNAHRPGPSGDVVQGDVVEPD